MLFVLHAFPWINFDLLGALVLTAAAVKEFYFDAKYELDQTFVDNLEDWMGYAAASSFSGCTGWHESQAPYR